MKKSITIAATLLSISLTAQKFPKLVNNDYEPNEVQSILIDNVNRHLDTAFVNETDSIGIALLNEHSYIITYQNYRYTYKLKDDSVFFTAMLVKKEKLYYRPYTALGVTVFSEAFCTMVTYNSINVPNDKKLHFIAGLTISQITGAFIYRKTKNTWLASGGAFAAGCIAGAGKEYIDRFTNGTVSNKDAYATFKGAFAGALTIKFTLHR